MDKLKVLLFEAEAARVRHKTVKERMRRKVDRYLLQVILWLSCLNLIRLARSGVNCGNIIMVRVLSDLCRSSSYTTSPVSSC